MRGVESLRHSHVTIGFLNVQRKTTAGGCCMARAGADFIFLALLRKPMNSEAEVKHAATSKKQRGQLCRERPARPFPGVMFELWQSVADCVGLISSLGSQGPRRDRRSQFDRAVRGASDCRARVGNDRSMRAVPRHRRLPSFAVENADAASANCC